MHEQVAVLEHGRNEKKEAVCNDSSAQQSRFLVVVLLQNRIITMIRHSRWVVIHAGGEVDDR